MCLISSSKTSGSVKMSRATRKTPFSASSSRAVSIVFWTVSSILFLQLFLTYLTVGGRGRGIPDHPEDCFRTAATLRMAAARGVDVAWAVRAVLDGMSDLRLTQRIAEADVHRQRLRLCGRGLSG